MKNPIESKSTNFLAKAPKVKLTASALASVAATVSSADAVLVQIDLTGNQISSGGGDQLNADVSGDGPADIGISAQATRNFGFFQSALALFNGQRAYASVSSTSTFYASAPGVGAQIAGSPITRTGGIQFTLNDPNWVASPSTAFLEIRAEASFSSAVVSLTRVVFDDGTGAPGDPTLGNVVGFNFGAASPIPEPSGLSLLALGAAGILMRRRREGAGTTPA